MEEVEREDVIIIDRGLIDLNSYLRIEDFIIPSIEILEHNTVITIGKSGSESNIKNGFFIKQRNIPIVHLDRGGDITIHSPGQLIIYPHFDIRQMKLRQFLTIFNDLIIDFLALYKISAYYDENKPGIWTDNRKICSVGIAIKRYVTYFGYALYVNPDLSLFDLINPCGYKDIIITSMYRETDNVNFIEVKEHFIKFLSHYFKRKYHLITHLQNYIS